MLNGQMVIGRYKVMGLLQNGVKTSEEICLHH